MGAPNFGRGNASKIYTMFFPTEEFVLNEDGEETEELEYIHPELDEIEEGIADIKWQLKELHYGSHSGSDRRNDGETFLVNLKQYKNYGDLEAYVEIYCFLEHGYHEGARLDWRINLGFNNSDFDDEIDLSQIQDEYGYSSDLSVGLQKILSPKVLVWLEKTKQEMIEKVEDVYDEVSGLKLKLDGVFSNGEAIYSEIK
jgi:hypothetical protein